MMSLELFELVAKKVSKVTNEIALHIMGEPLLHPKIGEILEITNRNNLSVHFTTNGSLNDKFSVLQNTNNLKQVNFSLHSYSANIQNRSLESYLFPIFELTKALIQKEIYVNYRLWDIDSKGLNKAIMAHISDYFSKEIVVDFSHGLRKSRKIESYLYLNFDTQFDFPSLKSENLGCHGSCYGLSSHFGVNTRGEVVPCCLDIESYIILGDLKTQNIEEILGSSRAQKMQEGFKSFLLHEELCQKCSFVRRFKKPISF